jgi:hypothetical protein
VIEGAHHDGEEYAWCEGGADVPGWFVAGWIAVMLAVLGMVAGLIA